MPPVGIRNKNYLNVKNGDDPWMDAGGKPSKSDAKGHAVFSSPEYGVRAGLLLLRTYFLKHERRTIRAILSRWAPASDTLGSQPGNPQNDPSQYALFVAQRMGIADDQKLELFRADKTIGNLGQLRALFAAMAAYEIGGGFVVPAAELDAGLELIEPGVTKHGVDPSPNVAKAAAAPAPAGLWRIAGSVGRADKGARNDPDDVETIQSMLRSAAMILGDPALDPGSIDGSIAPKPGKSDTVRAIVAFQRRFLAKPDGLIEVEGRTWRELAAVVSGTAGPVTQSSGKEYFPLAFLPAADWTKGARAFGANRGANRAHAACDLYAPEGTTIHAVADGTVVDGPTKFYAGTFALVVDHGKFLARYGEIRDDAFVQKGDSVAAGQPIARVGHLTGISVESDMLHLELYDKSAHGPLTVPAVSSAIAASGRPFLRRKDLVDPSPYLARWKSHLPGPVAKPAAGAKTAPSAAASSAAIPPTGFCVHIRRLREEQRSGMGHPRTIAEYQCYWNGAPIHDLDGQMAERGGPGDNTKNGVTLHLRIAAGRYPLAVHKGTDYKTYGYAAAGKPLPGLLLLETGKRTFILIHPAHHASAYVSSIGCINPAAGLKDADSRINLVDSRSRVIAIIEAMKTRMGAAFPKTGPIPDAIVVIEGEPG